MQQLKFRAAQAIYSVNTDLNGLSTFICLKKDMLLISVYLLIALLHKCYFETRSRNRCPLLQNQYVLESARKNIAGLLMELLDGFEFKADDIAERQPAD
jgi:hypothetical protein